MSLKLRMMTESKPPEHHPYSPASWNQRQLDYVAAELAKEYPQIPAETIGIIVTQTQAHLDASLGTVRFLAQARKNLNGSLPRVPGL